MEDQELGEMLLNFMLIEEFRPFFWSLIGRIKEVSTPVVIIRTMGRNRHKYLGWSSWFGIAGHMGQNLEAHSGTNYYGSGR